MEQFIDEASMKSFVLSVGSCSENQISRKRREIFEAINGDVFYPIDSWPKQFRLLFWKKPLSDRDTFKLTMHFLAGKWLFPT